MKFSGLAARGQEPASTAVVTTKREAVDFNAGNRLPRYKARLSCAFPGGGSNSLSRRSFGISDQRDRVQTCPASNGDGRQRVRGYAAPSRSFSRAQGDALPPAMVASARAMSRDCITNILASVVQNYKDHVQMKEAIIKNLYNKPTLIGRVEILLVVAPESSSLSISSK